MPNEQIVNSDQTSAFESPWSNGQRALRSLWEFCWFVFCQWTPKPFNPWRLFWLRVFEAKIEGTPTGVVGRLSARSFARMAEENGATRVSYEIEAALTGKLGSLGQPVLRAKMKEMERQFAKRVRAAFGAADSGSAP